MLKHAPCSLFWILLAAIASSGCEAGPPDLADDAPAIGLKQQLLADQSCAARDFRVDGKMRSSRWRSFCQEKLVLGEQ